MSMKIVSSRSENTLESQTPSNEVHPLQKGKEKVAETKGFWGIIKHLFLACFKFNRFPRHRGHLKPAPAPKPIASPEKQTGPSRRRASLVAGNATAEELGRNRVPAESGLSKFDIAKELLPFFTISNDGNDSKISKFNEVSSKIINNKRFRNEDKHTLILGKIIIYLKELKKKIRNTGKLSEA